MTFFIYNNHLSLNFTDTDNRIVDIPQDLTDKKKLFEIFSSSLAFPDYFGNNWDALYDCLSDLSWLKESNVILAHHDIPFKKNDPERNIYCDLLSDVSKRWIKNYRYKVTIIFPESCKEEIEQILKSNRG